MIGQSVPMRRIMRLIERIASSDVPVLITGESGTGKEITAQLIHKLSSRRDGPYLAVNCAAIPETLIESHLFGHEKGAFTGADRRKQGLFESANGGTLLLDEITEMRCETQAKLLRVIEERKVLPIGSTREIPINVRVLAASNRRIEHAIRDGHLREDLYYRLKVCSIHLPPLRERIGDLPLLIDHFVERTNEEHGRQITGIDDSCITALAGYWWPGNVRELKHAIEHAVIFCESTRLAVSDLPSEIEATARPDSSFTVHLGSSMKDVVDELICRTVTYAGGNKVRAAKILGVNRRTIYSRLENYEVHETSGPMNGRPYRNGRNGMR
jgi:two-component system, NtrC family, response regulator HydG